MSIGRALQAAAMLSFLAIAPLLAHHTYSADYDNTRVVELRGSITRLEWVNPHGAIHITVATPEGTDETWKVEIESPATLNDQEITREMLSPGTAVMVKGYAARTGGLRAWAVDITFADGVTRKMEFVRKERPLTLANFWQYTLPIWINEYSAFVLMALPFVVLFIGLYRLRSQARKARQ